MDCIGRRIPVNANEFKLIALSADHASGLASELLRDLGRILSWFAKLIIKFGHGRIAIVD